MPSLRILMEVAEGANVGPQVYDRDMRRVFVAGVNDEAETEVIVKSEPLCFELVFGPLDCGEVDAVKLTADIGEKVFADFFIGNAPFTGAQDVEGALQRFIIRGID